MDKDIQDNRKNSQKRKGGERGVFMLILLCLLLVGGGAFFLYSYTDLLKTHSVNTSGDPLSVSPTINKKNKIPKPSHSSPAISTKTIENHDEPLESTAKPEQKEQKQESCSKLEKHLQDFFYRIDNQAEVKKAGLEQKSDLFFLDLTQKLLDNPPIVTRETDNLLSILKNMAHLFRTIGNKNIIIIKAVINQEHEEIENVANSIYNLVVHPRCPENKFKAKGETQGFYDYAGFFLTTIGGRAYLFRRDSKSRLLVNYYSILIIEDANEKQKNKYGIDLQQIIPSLIGEMESSNKLKYKNRYLDRLYLLLEKYQ